MRQIQENLMIQFSVLSILLVLIFMVFVLLIFPVRRSDVIEAPAQDEQTMKLCTLRLLDRDTIPGVTSNTGNLCLLALFSTVTGMVVLYLGLFLVVYRGWRKGKFVVSNSEITIYRGKNQGDSEARLKNSQRLAHMGDWTWNPINNIIKWSDEMYRIYGIDPENVSDDLNTILLQLIHPDDRARVSQASKIIQTGAKHEPFEYRVIRSDGSLRWIWTQQGDTLFDEKGQVAQLSGIVQDITGRKQMEKALRENEATIQSILDNTPAMIYVKDLEGRYLLINQQYETLVKLKNDEIKGKTSHEVYPEKLADQFVVNDRKVRETKTSIQSEEMILQEDGMIHTYLTILFPLYDASGRMNAFCGIYTDITGQKQMQKQQIEMAIQKERIQLLEEIISDLSHDIKTPLASIKMKIYLLKKKIESEKHWQYLDKMDAQIQGLIKLVEDILMMSRLTRGTGLIFAPINLNDLITTVSKTYQDIVEEKKIDLTFDLSEDLPLILGNQSGLTRALANLCENAINYTPENKSIMIRTYAQDTEVIFEIEDTGVGIPEADLPYIFDRFYRADLAKNMSKGGTGLGLAIVKKIVDLHSGMIDVESKIEQGTCFRLTMTSAREILD